MAMRYLAIDRGGKRTGLAAGDDVMKLAMPVSVVESKAEHVVLEEINKAVDEHGANALVVGLPLNMDGSEGPSAKSARQFAKTLESQTGLPIHLVDERETSLLADDIMARTGLTHGQKKARRDALAAAAILQRFFDDPSSLVE